MRVTKKPKKERKKEKEPKQWQTGYSPRQPMTSDQDIVWHGGWSSGGTLVLSFKFHENWLSSYRDVRVKNLAHCITFANGLYSPVLLYKHDIWLFVCHSVVLGCCLYMYNAGSLSVITEMIDQVMSAHPDISLFHIGADEVCVTSVCQ